MDKEDFKNQLINANITYRQGNPIMADQEFDDMLETFKKTFGENEYTILRSRMFEEGGKVKHKYLVGSLEKTKYEEPENVLSWINTHVKNSLNISCKCDGISCVLKYVNGKLISATSRGNGSTGENLTDKIFYVNGIPREISEKEETYIRGELVCKTADFEDISNSFANKRNFVAGVMNRKDWTPEQISKISLIAYTVLGKKFTKKEQFEFLENNGFDVAWHKSFSIAELQALTYPCSDRLMNMLRDYAKRDYGFDCDGLVMSDDNYRNENVLIPENQVAFKVNDSIAETTVIDIEWGEPSKNGRLSPIIIIEPVELDGVTVSRVTGNNLDYLEKMNIRFGSKVKIIRSGMVIPKIIDVINNPDYSKKIIPPTRCPICDSKLVVNGVDLCCVNPNCDSKQLSTVASFIKKFDVKHSAKKQLDNFGIKTIDDLIAFLPNQAYKSEVTLYNEIKEKIFTASPKKIFCAMNFKGLAEIQLAKIVDQYGLDWILSLKYVETEKFEMQNHLPNGIGLKSIDTFWEYLLDAIENTKKIIADSRYSYSSQNDNNIVKKSSIKGSICFTGTLESMGRKEAQKLAESAGFEIKNGVNKGLTYLVIADPNSMSNKANKAREFGTKLLSEKEFLAICKNEKEEQNLEDL